MYIIITLPYFIHGEGERITSMFEAGLQRLHLRKPESHRSHYRELLQAIPACYHERIVLHDHFSLAEEFAVGGVHLNRRNPEPPVFASFLPTFTVSKSCHSIDELRECKATGKYDYLSLSPIFDSISKEGHHARFTHKELLAAKAEGVIDERVMALGGICSDNIADALGYGFGGVMVLGDAWRTSVRGEGERKNIPTVLSIAGSDPSAGAGVQQDLKTITHHGCYGATVITSLTSQNTLGVQSAMAVPAEVVESQLRSVFADLRVDAVKIGMLPNEDVARVVVRVLTEERKRRVLPIICDPVMISTSGHPLMTDACIEFVERELFPLCTLVTPNIPETERLPSLSAQHGPSVLFKGGHAESAVATDVLFLAGEQRRVEYTSLRVDSPNLHGTGCTLSSAIASNMALGHSLETAVRLAKTHIDQVIRGGMNIRIGHGNGPLWFAK